MKSKLSLKKIAANRRNARRSTGPRTPAGKNKVRWNALQHGLLSRELLFPVGEARRKRNEYAGLLAGLRQDLEPRGALEELLVEKIAICYWRLRRVLRCEGGEIRKAQEEDRSDEMQRKGMETARAYLQLGREPEAARRKLTSSSFGLHYLTHLVNELRHEVEQVGYLTKEAYQKLRRHFGGHNDGVAQRCLRWSRAITAAAEQAEGHSAQQAGLEEPGAQPHGAAGQSAPSANSGLTPAPQAPIGAAAAEPSEKYKELIIQALFKEELRLEREAEWREHDEQQQRAGHQASLSLPNEEALRRIVRYEASIQRDLHRAIRELRSLRQARRRKGGKS